MPILINMDSLKDFLQETINKALENDVAHVVKKVEQRNIDKTVYDATVPYVYERRTYNGGLIDIKNMKSELIGDGILKVANITKPNKKYKNSLPVTADLPELIEYGDGYNHMLYTWHRSDGTDYEFKNPRPFTENTVEELKTKEQHIKALKQGLKNQKIKVE